MGPQSRPWNFPLNPASSSSPFLLSPPAAQSLYLAPEGGDASPFRLQVVDRVEIATGDVHQYCVRATGGPLTVTLVWADFPGRPYSVKALVNDLDLTVRAAGLNGIPLLGNGGSVDDSTTNDRENNVEEVSVGNMPEGQVSIEVRGFSTYASAGAQPYALVVNGGFAGSLVTPGSGADAGQCTIVLAGEGGRGDAGGVGGWEVGRCCFRCAGV